MPLKRLLAAVSLVASAAMAGDGVWIRVAPDGWATALSEPPKSLDDGDALWTWSLDCAPRRQTSLEVPPCAALDAVTVRVIAARRTPAVSEIRWGTEAMIREVPEALLPSVRTDATGTALFRIPKEETVFARVAGPALASGWSELHTGARSIRAAEAANATTRVVDEGGAPAVHARIEVRTLDASQPRGLPFLAAGDGAIALPPVPVSAYVKLLAWSDRSAPAVLTAAAQKLPQRIALQPGFVISGRVVDEQHDALSGASLSALFLVAGEGSEVQKRALSDRKGQWRIGGIPAADVEWNVARKPFAASSRVVRVTADLDVGAAVLSRARDVAVVVTDERGAPIAQAKVGTPDGVSASADARGIALLRGVPATSFTASVAARGYHTASARVAEQTAKPVAVALRRATRLRARIVSADDGKPAASGSATVQFNKRTSVVEIGAGGVVEIDDLDAGTVSLEIHASGLAPYRVPPRAVAGGELVDLGTIALERGLGLTGRTVDAASGAPLAGVVVRALRPSSFGPLLSYMSKEWVSAESDANGTFTLRGLAPGLYSIWTEAAAHAPLVKNGVTVAAQPAGGEADIGDLSIPAPHLLKVRCEPAPRCGSEASALISGADWLPIHSSVVDGNASVGPLPAGAARLRLSDRRGIIHERDVSVAADDAVTEIAVQLPAVTITGVVTRAGSPAGGGTVTLTNAPDSAAKFMQIATPRAAGTIGNDIVGSVPRQVSAPVSQDGRFEIRDAAPGEYDALWTSDGRPSPPKRVSIAEAPEAFITIEIAAATLAGTVRTAEGGAPRRALVALEQGGRRAQTLASSDGSFSFVGVESGPAVVRASDADGATAEREINVGDDVARVDLTLDQASKEPAAVLVTSHGAPLPNAFVFLRATGGMHAATTGDDGRATFELRKSEQVLGVAAFSAAAGWGFAAAPLGSAEARVEIPGSAGALVIRTASGGAAIVLESPTGFPIQEALATLGVPPVAYASSPLRVSGVPAGSYRIIAGGVVRTERVSDGVHEVNF